MAMVPAGLDAKSDRAGWLPAVSYCTALLCRQFRRSSEVKEEEGEYERISEDQRCKMQTAVRDS
jgi:hypothetical protein